MRRLLAAGLGASLALMMGAAAAQAAPGYVTTNVNLRSGPGVQYPPVVVLGAGMPLEIFGCLSDTSWCDVDWNGNRGWVAGDFLEYSYQGRRVLVPEYAPYIGLPIVTFSFNDYWGRYYRGRSWYSGYDRWGPSRPPGWGGGHGWNGHGKPPPHWGGGPGPGRPPGGGPGWGNGPGNGPGWGGPGPGRPPGGGKPPQWGGGGPGGPGNGPGGPGWGGPGPGKPPGGGKPPQWGGGPGQGGPGNGRPPQWNGGGGGQGGSGGGRPPQWSGGSGGQGGSGGGRPPQWNGGGQGGGGGNGGGGGGGRPPQYSGGGQGGGGYGGGGQGGGDRRGQQCQVGANCPQPR